MSNPKLAAKSLILASGPENPGAAEVIRSVLRQFVFEELELQRIDLGGRTIVAILIAHDRAHTTAINRDLDGLLKSERLDVALLEIEDASP